MSSSRTSEGSDLRRPQVRALWGRGSFVRTLAHSVSAAGAPSSTNFWTRYDTSRLGGTGVVSTYKYTFLSAGVIYVTGYKPPAGYALRVMSW